VHDGDLGLLNNLLEDVITQGCLFLSSESGISISQLLGLSHMVKTHEEIECATSCRDIDTSIFHSLLDKLGDNAKDVFGVVDVFSQLYGFRKTCDSGHLDWCRDGCEGVTLEHVHGSNEVLHLLREDEATESPTTSTKPFGATV